jgi:hypothetical protein
LTEQTTSNTYFNVVRVYMLQENNPSNVFNGIPIEIWKDSYYHRHLSWSG